MLFRRIALIVLGCVILTNAALAALLAPTKGTLPFYWITGTLSGDNIANRMVIIYKDDLKVRIEKAADENGKYRINAYELYYYLGVPITLEGAVTYKIAAPMYGEFTNGTEEVVDLVISQGFMTQNLTLVEGGGPQIVPKALGPEIDIKVLLQGFYKAGAQKETSVIVEARKVQNGNDEVGNATKVVGTSEVALDSENNTRGSNGFGKDFPAGDYYLVVKHLEGGVSIHLPVITTNKVSVPGSLDLSTIELAYTPMGKLGAMISKDAKYLIWGGDMNGDKIVDESDFTIWLDKRRNDQENPITDLNGDGMVDESDYTLWLESRRGIGVQIGVQSYVPFP